MSDTLDRRGPHVSAQVAASFTAWEREAMNGELSKEDEALQSALEETNRVIRDFIDGNGTPGPRGPRSTQHGEIAERVTVGIRRASAILEREIPDATFDGVGRKGPVDYVIDGRPIQSKYAHSLLSTLNEIRHHIEQYGPDFKQYGYRKNGAFHIPADQHVQLKELHDTGTIQGMSRTKLQNIRDRLREIERATDRGPMDVIDSGEGTYGEVRWDRIDDTLENLEANLKAQSGDNKDAIEAKLGPSLEGLVQAMGIGGVTGGGVGISQALIVKYRNGKNPFKGEYTQEDWADVGLAGSQGGVGGAVAGGAVYGLTNLTDLVAPFAGSLVSTIIGIKQLMRSYRSGEIDKDQFVDLSHFVACEAAAAGLAAAAGQAVIPIPIVGAILGSVAGKIIMSTLKRSLEHEAVDLAARLSAYEKAALARLDADCREWIARLDGYFADLDRIAKLAFDPAANTALRLGASVRFARRLNVPEDLILASSGELDTFMTK